MLTAASHDFPEADLRRVSTGTESSVSFASSSRMVQFDAPAMSRRCAGPIRVRSPPTVRTVVDSLRLYPLQVVTMKALAVRPGVKHSAHIAEMPTPRLSDIPGGRGVLVRTLQVGVDATDAEINEALYGAAPDGQDFLVLGHEVFGVVEEVGPNVTHVRPGDLCTCTVRRPGPDDLRPDRSQRRHQ